MKVRYKAILFSRDGAWVTDYRNCTTKQEVWEHIDNQGSRWIFYPYVFIIIDHGSLTRSRQCIIDAPEGFEYVIGHYISTISRMFALDSEKEGREG